MRPLSPWPDRAMAGALAGVTAASLWALPWVLGLSDEGLILYEGRRILEGEVLYRDVFELLTPGSLYILAGLYWVFGATIETARGADALIHGGIAAAIFLIARRLGVRRGIAVAAALLHPALIRPVWDVFSPHWLSTLAGLGLLWTLLGEPRADPFRCGLWSGLVVAIQQQRGTSMVVCASILLTIDWWRSGGEPLRLLARFAAGVALPVVPVLAYATWAAGPYAVFQALVLHPLIFYRRHNHDVPWGTDYVPWYTRYALPRVLVWAPVLTLGELVRATSETARGKERTRRSWVLAIVSLSWAVSILYLPDVIHCAIIAPVFAVLLADLAEAGLAAMGSVGRSLGWVLSTGAIALLVVQLVRIDRGTRRDYPIAHETAFGTLWFRDRELPELIDRVREAVAEAPGRELLVYPVGAGFYLFTGGINPTPYQLMTPLYSRPDQLEEVVATLERRRPPYVLQTAELPGDLVHEYLSRTYERLPGRDTAPFLLRRRASQSPS